MNYKLDKQERELLELFEQGGLKSSENAALQMDNAKKAAAEHTKKNARINIRLSQFDLDRIKRIAVSEGLPYQTLISSILHKYVNRTM
jgi:predicted DNA binding CopG/RHH family protein